MIKKSLAALMLLTAFYATAVTYDFTPLMCIPTETDPLASLDEIGIVFPDEVFLSDDFIPEIEETGTLHPCSWIVSGSVLKIVPLDDLNRNHTTYTLTIPAGMIGDAAWSENHDDGSANPELSYAWTVSFAEPKYTLAPVSVSPSDMEVVDEVSRFVFVFDCDIYLNPAMAEPVVYNRVRDSYTGSLEVSADHRSLIYALDTPITEPGTYILAIERGTVGTAEWADSGYTDGDSNDQMMAVCTILKQYPPLEYDLLPISVDPEDCSIVTEISEILIDFGRPVAYDWERAKVMITDTEGKEYKNWFALRGSSVVRIVLNTPITADGMYTLTIPAGTFGTSTWIDSGCTGDICNPELIYSWQIGAQVGIDAFEVEGGEVVYYDLSGRRVSNPQNIAPGVYLIHTQSMTRKVVVF